MLKQYVKDLNTNIYLNAAEELGYQLEVIDFVDSFAKVTHNQKTLLIYENWLGLNNQVTYALAKNKYVSGKILEKVIPELIPDTIMVSSQDDFPTIVEFAKKHAYSIVVKPNSASLGKGVSVLPQDEAELLQIASDLLKEYDFILIQKMIVAKREYRIVYLEGQFFDALLREHASVTGDGQHPIADLIATKNAARQPHDFPLIKVDQRLENKLAESQLSLSSVLPAAQKAVLKDVCSFAQGGEVKRFGQAEIHPDFIAAFEKVTKVSELDFIGIDLICEDITQPLTGQSAGINEINSAPMCDVHYFADLLDNHPLASAKKLLTQLLG